MNTINLVTEKMQNLPTDQQNQVLDFVEFLMLKYQSQVNNNLTKKSAEAKAIERLKDVDDPEYPTKWTTVIDIDDSIDEKVLEEWLEKGNNN